MKCRQVSSHENIDNNMICLVMPRKCEAYRLISTCVKMHNMVIDTGKSIQLGFIVQMIPPFIYTFNAQDKLSYAALSVQSSNSFSSPAEMIE